MNHQKKEQIEKTLNEFSMSFAGSSIIERHEVTRQVLEYLDSQNLKQNEKRNLLTYYTKKRGEYQEK